MLVIFIRMSKFLKRKSSIENTASSHGGIIEHLEYYSHLQATCEGNLKENPIQKTYCNAWMLLQKYIATRECCCKNILQRVNVVAKCMFKRNGFDIYFQDS